MPAAGNLNIGAEHQTRLKWAPTSLFDSMVQIGKGCHSAVEGCFACTKSQVQFFASPAKRFLCGKCWGKSLLEKPEEL